MRAYERDRRGAGRPAGWRSSEGRMREVSPRPVKEGKHHLTGYVHSPAAQDRGLREAGRLSGSYGDVAVGTNRKRELTLVVSKRRSREGPQAVQDEQALRGDSGVRMPLARGRFRTNSHSRSRSAVEYRESHQKPPSFLLNRFRDMMTSRRQDTLDEQVPFLDRAPEREGLRRLQGEADALRARGGPADRLRLREIERERQQLRQTLTEKEGQERRLRLILLKAQEESRRRGGEAERLPWQSPAPAELLSEDGGAGGEFPDGAPDGRADGAPDGMPDEAADGAPDGAPDETPGEHSQGGPGLFEPGTEKNE